MKIDAHLEPFVAPTTFSWIYFILYLGFLIAVTAGAYHPFAGLGIAVLFAVLFYGEQTTRFSPLSSWVPQGLSHNVTAKIPPREKNNHHSLVLVAHYDTSKTALIFNPRGVKGLRNAYLVSLVMIGLIIIGSAARIFAPAGAERIIDWVMVVPGVYMAIMCLGMMEREVRGIPVNGAADNASGVAIVMELVKRIKENKGLLGWETIVLLTGSEEVGLAGMSHFISGMGRRLDRKHTVFINFDNLGGGKVTYITAEGMLYHLPADPVLKGIADEVKAADPRFREVGSRVFDALTLDTLVPAARGFRVITIMGLNQDGVPYPWHWFNDTLENLDREVTRLGAEFGWEIVKRLAPEKQGEPKPVSPEGSESQPPA